MIELDFSMANLVLRTNVSCCLLLFSDSFSANYEDGCDGQNEVHVLAIPFREINIKVYE